ncbi:MAG: hypothetical protein FJ313_06530, partial [Gemmatimonadetes bacterium]|nr:hypothetical protein [Gemmatimonadota bacterium]
MERTGKTKEYGNAGVEPSGPVVAGSYGTWRLTFEAGAIGVAPGGVIRVTTDSDTDWGMPQFTDPAAADYMTVEAPPGATADVQAVDLRTVRAVVRGRGLRPGERLTLVYGDRSGGGPGSRAQTFLEPRHHFCVDVDPEGTGGLVTLDDSPWVTVVGGDAVRLVVTAPSDALVGQPFRVLVKAEDRWGNPAGSYRGAVELSGDGLELSERVVLFGEAEHGARWVEGVRPTRTGVLHVHAVDRATGLGGRSNPVVCRTEAPEHALCWADPHGGQVALNSKIADFFRYARDVAGLDFVGYQRNDNLITHEDWRVQQEQEAASYEPGRF